MRSGPALNPARTDFAERIPLPEWDRSGPVIIQTLESPHKDEYIPVGKPARPAAGFRKRKTGLGLSELYPQAYPMHTHPLQDGRYALVLVNAIQYQCSLGVHPEAHRTAVFKQCWNSFGRKDYIARIMKMYQPGDIVINSCTAGGLRELVQGALEEVMPQGTGGQTTIIKLVHPCRFEWK